MKQTILKLESHKTKFLDFLEKTLNETKKYTRLMKATIDEFTDDI